MSTSGPYYMWATTSSSEGGISDEDLVEYILSEPVRQMLWDAGYEVTSKDTPGAWWEQPRDAMPKKVRKKW